MIFLSTYFYYTVYIKNFNKVPMHGSKNQNINLDFTSSNLINVDKCSIYTNYSRK